MRLSGYGASNAIAITDEPPETDVQFPNTAGALATQGMGAQPSIPRPFSEWRDLRGSNPRKAFRDRAQLCANVRHRTRCCAAYKLRVTQDHAGKRTKSAMQCHAEFLSYSGPEWM